MAHVKHTCGLRWGIVPIPQRGSRPTARQVFKEGALRGRRRKPERNKRSKQRFSDPPQSMLEHFRFHPNQFNGCVHMVFSPYSMQVGGRYQGF